MSRFCSGIAVLLLLTAQAGPVFARGHGGGGHHRRGRAPAPSHATGKVDELSPGSGLRNWRWLSNPAARGKIAAAAALAGWRGGRDGNGWWRHGDGIYGWVGPLFWPFAYHDIYDYTIWGDGIGFWGYGFVDVEAGIFGPYGADDLKGYIPPDTPGREQHSSHPSIAQLCREDRREVADLPIDQIGRAIELNEAQWAALDDLGYASIQAAETVRAACPTEVAATAPDRLAAMQQRIEAMISAVTALRPSLEHLYAVLDDEQKARLMAVAEESRVGAPTAGSPAQGCSPAPPLQWSEIEIDARLHPTDVQRPALSALQDATARAAETLRASCQPQDALTPPARLAAVANRLDVMLQAVKLLRPALEDLYATLSDEQKAQFEAIGSRRAAG